MSRKAEGQAELFRQLEQLRREPIYAWEQWAAEIQEITAFLFTNLPDTHIHLEHAVDPKGDFFLRFGPSPVGQGSPEILILRIFPWGNRALLRLYWVPAEAEGRKAYSALCAGEAVHTIDDVALDMLFDAVDRMCRVDLFRREVLHHRYLALPFPSSPAIP